MGPATIRSLSANSPRGQPSRHRRELSITENLQREDVSPIEEATQVLEEEGAYVNVLPVEYPGGGRFAAKLSPSKGHPMEGATRTA